MEESVIFPFRFGDEDTANPLANNAVGKRIKILLLANKAAGKRIKQTVQNQELLLGTFPSIQGGLHS